MLAIYRKQYKRIMPAIALPEGPGGREVCASSGRGAVEYRRRTEIMWMRQLGYCTICLKPMRLEEATFDHADGRGSGGWKRDDRIEVNGVWQNSAVHGFCNVQKASEHMDVYMSRLEREKFKETA